MVGRETLECNFFLLDRRKYRIWCGMGGRWQKKGGPLVRATPYIKNDNPCFIVTITGKAKRVARTVKRLTTYTL